MIDNSTVVNSTGLLFTLAMAMLMLVAPRRYAFVPVIVLVCYMTMGQRVVIAGLNFTMLRVLLLFAWLRLFVRGEFYRVPWNTVDRLVFLWVAIRTVNYTLVWGDTSALVNRLGYAYDIVGCYFLFRFLVRDTDDMLRIVRFLAIFIIPVAAFMLLEKVSGRNAFAAFGGVPLIPEIRDGVLRCQGPFSHSILAGTFGATMIPLFVGGYMSGAVSIWLTGLSILASTAIVVTAGSSGPVLAYAFGVLALCLWPLRRYMRIVRWSILLVLVALQFVMNAPIWFVMARLSVFSGSTGWYRGYLIDMTVKHFNEWWLIGSNAAPTWHFYLADVTNQYIAEGLSGGLFAMILFIAIITLSYREIGRSVRSANISRSMRYFSWAMGATLLTHTVSFFSVSYFDQNVVTFYLLLAAIGTLSVSLSTAREQDEVMRPVNSESFAPAGYAF